MLLLDTRNDDLNEIGVVPGWSFCEEDRAYGSSLNILGVACSNSKSCVCNNLVIPLHHEVLIIAKYFGEIVPIIMTSSFHVTFIFDIVAAKYVLCME